MPSRGIRMTLWIPRRPQHTRHSYHLVCDKGACWVSGCFFLFFSSRLLAAIRSQGAVLLVSFQALGLFLYWPVSRCAKSKGKVQAQSPVVLRRAWVGNVWVENWKCARPDRSWRQYAAFPWFASCRNVLLFADTGKKKGFKSYWIPWWHIWQRQGWRWTLQKLWNQQRRPNVILSIQLITDFLQSS